MIVTDVPLHPHLLGDVVLTQATRKNRRMDQLQTVYAMQRELEQIVFQLPDALQTAKMFNYQ